MKNVEIDEIYQILYNAGFAILRLGSHQKGRENAGMPKIRRRDKSPPLCFSRFEITTVLYPSISAIPSKSGLFSRVFVISISVAVYF